MQDKYVYKSKDGTEIRLLNTFTICTKCGAMKPMSKVGLRKVKDVFYNQPRCMDCRSK